MPAHFPAVAAGTALLTSMEIDMPVMRNSVPRQEELDPPRRVGYLRLNSN
jgi:hypothetical protein